MVKISLKFFPPNIFAPKVFALSVVIPFKVLMVIVVLIMKIKMVMIIIMMMAGMIMICDSEF